MLRKKLVVLLTTMCIAITTGLSYRVKAASIEANRIGGQDRYETCSKIVQQGWKTTSDYAVLVNGENFPDALSASVLAKKYNAPILLTDSSKLNSFTYKELKRISVKKVLIVGGGAVITPQVEKELNNMGISTERFSGQDRTATSVAVAEHIGGNNGIILTTDNDYTDALSIAPIAAKLQMPIILMPKEGIPESVEKFKMGQKFPKTYIIGSKNLISEDVALQFYNSERIDGEDKYKKNLSIIQKFSDKMDFTNIYLAYSEKFADALSASAIASINTNPIILSSDEIDANTKYFINSKKDCIKTLSVLGGTAGIKDKTINSIINNTDETSENLHKYDIENNGSTVTKEGDWIYYSGNRQYSMQPNFLAVSELYRIKNDNSRTEKLSDDFASKIWIDGEWVYYINYKGSNEKNCLYRVKKDGKDRQQITETTPAYVEIGDNNIYYANYSLDDKSHSFEIYKIDKDGKNKTRLGKDKGIYLTKVGDWIYYSDIDDNFNIYRMNLDGSNSQLISKNSAANYMKVIGDWIYYINGNDNNSLYRTTLDGKENQKLNNDDCRNIDIYDGHIYYSSLNDDIGILYKMNLDGSNKEKLSEVDCSTDVKVKDNYVYCCGFKSKGVYRIKTDGTGYENININESLISLDVVGDWIYYVRFNSSDMTNKLYKMKLDGSLDQRVD